MSLVFYYAPWSSATTCHWAIEELGVPCERIKVDLAKNETHTPEFLAMNPNGKVPLLVHDGVPIYESIAILAHLGETFGVEKGLFPGPGLQRAHAFQWLAWMNVTLGHAVYRYLENSSDQTPAELRNAKVADLAKLEVQKLLAMLDQHLSGKTWMVGDTFTLVDAHLIGGMSWVDHTMPSNTTNLPNIAAWTARSRARPAFAAVTRLTGAVRPLRASSLAVIETSPAPVAASSSQAT